MAVINDGSAVSGALAVDTNTKAARISVRPLDVLALGHYRLGAFTGILPIIGTLGANAEIFQFRWTDATRFAIIRRVRISAVVSTTFFAAGVPVMVDLVKATGWSAAGTGGTSVSPAATLKKRSSFGSTLVAAGDIRIATTAALGAGTKTLEGNSMAALAAPGPITASLNGQIFAPTDLLDNDVAHGEYPLALVAANEGFVIRCVNAPATGTWTASVEVDWAEVAAY